VGRIYLEAHPSAQLAHQPLYLRSPANQCLSPFLSSLWHVGPARRPHCLLLLLPNAAPHRIAPGAPQPRARMRRLDHRAGTHAELARAPLTHSRGFCEGKLPLLPLPVTLKGGKPPLVVSHVAALGKSSNGSPVRRSFPLRCFDRALITQGRAPCAS
jgi:hypothetical protein